MVEDLYGGLAVRSWASLFAWSPWHSLGSSRPGCPGTRRPINESTALATLANAVRARGTAAPRLHRGAREVLPGCC